MPINFDDLPKTNEAAFTIFEDGKYHCKIKDAKIPTGKDYLSVTFTVFGNNGKTTTIFDNFFDSDKSLPRFKLAQLIRALKLPLTGTFELKDLPKIIIGKELIAVIKQEQNEGYQPRNIINAFDDDIFLPIDSAQMTMDDDESPFAEPNSGGRTY